MNVPLLGQPQPTERPAYGLSAEAEFLSAEVDPPGWAFGSAAARAAEPVFRSTGELDRPCDTRVLIVDDCALHRECLVGVLGRRRVAVAPGLAWDLTSLIAELQVSVPQLILLNMATRDSAMLLRQVMKLAPHVRVVVLGVAEDDERGIVECAEAGAAGYHLRTESLDDLLVLIDKVAAGESSCSPRVSAVLLKRLSALASQRPRPDKELVLTGREIQILRLLESGLGNREIADQLCIAVHTVKNHVHSVLTKLGVETRVQAAAVASAVCAAQDRLAI